MPTKNTKTLIALNASREALIILKHQNECKLAETSENLPIQVNELKRNIKLCKDALRKIDNVG